VLYNQLFCASLSAILKPERTIVNVLDALRIEEVALV